MTNRIEQLVEELVGPQPAGVALDLLDDHLRRGDSEFVAQFGAVLLRRYGAGGGEHRYLFERLLWRLATTPGRENVGHALRLGLAALGEGPRPERRAAAVLAEYQSVRDLGPVFAPGRSGGGADELRACLIHELALRGGSAEGLPEAVAWAGASPYWQEHPLSWLPWTLAPQEVRPVVPHYFVGGMTFGSRYTLPEGAPLPSRAAGDVPLVTANRLDFALEAAVDRWSRRHNGRVESGIHLTDAPVGPDTVHPVLLSLSLDCLAELAGPDRLTVFTTTPAEAWSVLFAAASLGGGHSNDWWYGAYGRLAAWRSVAALVGAPDGAAPAEVEQLAGACTWYGFSASTHWFNYADMDIGLLVLSPDGRRLAVLAATDYNGG
ncbi:DUF6183 family protein [Kitasatospora sp. NPDC002227]|uniref:DUF6183 family protein n=1 Tax=Kitasatospora sp. NPDC002227 TaxID=3154773 RepID=UPI00331D4030